MTIDARTLTRLYAALREGREIEVRYENAVIRTAHAAPVWGVPMVVGYCADCGCYTVRQWCRSVEELAERLEKL